MSTVGGGAQSGRLRPLRVDMAELCIALENEVKSFDWFFDTQTGQTVLLNAEYDPEEYGGLTPQQVRSNPERFRPVPPGDDAQALGDMEQFAKSHPDERLRDSLQLALEAPRPDRRFRAVLGWLPEEQHRWHAFRQRQLEARARSWLAHLGIQPEAA